jgi:hypothetical protein
MVSMVPEVAIREEDLGAVEQEVLQVRPVDREVLAAEAEVVVEVV